jgi:hypothetical protein
VGTTELDAVSIPATGYTRFGVTAVVGHTYVAMAQEGEEGNYIVFRIESMDSDSVTLRYLYVSP